MSDLTRDPVINVITKGIKRDITVALDNQCWRATLILCYSAIDVMASLSRAANRNTVDRQDFIAWCDRYMRLPGPFQITGVEYYGARCGLLHSYEIASNFSRSGQARMIAYGDKGDPPVRFDPNVTTTLIWVAIPALKDALFEGIDRFLIDSFKDKTKAPIVEARLNELIHALPMSR